MSLMESVTHGRAKARLRVQLLPSLPCASSQVRRWTLRPRPAVERDAELLAAALPQRCWQHLPETPAQAGVQDASSETSYPSLRDHYGYLPLILSEVEGRRYFRNETRYPESQCSRYASPSTGKARLRAHLPPSPPRVPSEVRRWTLRPRPAVERDAELLAAAPPAKMLATPPGNPCESRGPRCFG